MRSPAVVADVPDAVAPALKEISASSSTPHPPASTVSEDVGLSPRSSSVAPVEPGPSSVTSDISSECTDTGSKKICRKRPRQPSTWKQNERKMLKNTGKAYIGFKGKEVLSKTIGPGCNEKCPKKCQQQFNGQREEIFSNYWKSGDVNIQRQFIASFVSKSNTDRVRTKNPTSRRKSTLYDSFLKSGQKKSVCRKFFLDTLGIKQDVVYGALDKLTSGGIVSVDGRVFHKNHLRINEETVEEIKEHIKSFPALPSHYCRQSTDRMYLEADLNMSIIYRLYVEMQRSKGKPCAEISKYSDVFLKEFNLGFFSPKKTNVICVYLSAPHPLHHKSRYRSMKIM